MNKIIGISLKTSIIFLLACTVPAKKGTPWEVDKQLKKTVGNVSFTFPSKGYAYEKRNKLVADCLDAVKSNLALIKLHDYTDTISIHFLTSRQAMKKYTGMTPSGSALVQPKILHVVANGDPKEVKPPIKHELMHMISMTTWGYSGQDSNWMNEGLAALAKTTVTAITMNRFIVIA